MRMLAALAFIALGTTAAAAQPGRASDVEYLNGARCVGLASSGKLGTADVDAMKAWLKSQRSGRIGYVMQKADEMRRDAKREADQAGAEMKARLSAELNGPCARAEELAGLPAAGPAD